MIGPHSEDEKRVRSFFETARLMRYLGLAADARENFLTGPAEDRQRHARWLWSCCMGVIQEVMGAEAVSVLFQPFPSDRTDRKADLLRIVDHLNMLESIPTSPETFMSLRSEILAIANGDTPRLLSALPGNNRGRPTNSYKISELKLNALAWKEYLMSSDFSAEKSEAIISNAFGVTWNTIRQWRKPIAKSLGDERTNLCLEMAKDRMFPVHNEKQAVVDEIIRRHGREYQDELRSR